VSQFGAGMNAMLSGSEFHAGALRAAVLAFLKATLAGGPKAVCELELKAAPLAY
jgi:hypothetical protein